MPTQTLTPTQLVADGSGLDITALLAAPTQTTLLFANTGRELLVVAAATTALTVTVDIGALVLGQAVSNFSSVTLTNAHTSIFGPFHSVLDQSGTNQIQVVLSSTTSITVALLQMVGVY
jgi:hypothetical protein